MNRLPLTVIFLSLFLLSPAFAVPTWHIETIDSDGNVGNYCSLALDSLNRPHISYYYETDSGNNPKLKYAFWNGNTWQTQVVDDVGQATSIAVDSSDHPHISYLGTSFSLKYAYFNGNTWVRSVVESGISVGHTSIALDTVGNPNIVYDVFVSGIHSLKYASFDGTNWTIVTIDTLNGPQNGKLCIDSNDLPHISYLADLVADLRYAYFDGTIWHLETVDPNGVSFNSLALDTNGNPHIAYQRSSAGLYYAYNLGSGWQVSGTTIDPGSIQSPSIDVDYLNNVHISYCRYVTHFLRYTHFDGMNWSIEDIESLNYGTGINIRVNSVNLPHIVYQQTSGLNLNYAWFGDGSLGVSINYFAAFPRNENIEITWDLQNVIDSGIMGLNLYRKEVFTNSRWIKLNSYPISTFTNGSYIDLKADNDKEYLYKITAIINSGKETELGVTSYRIRNLSEAFYISNIHPQPATNLVVCDLHSGIQGNFRYELFDISGRLVKTAELPMHSRVFSFDIPLNSLSNGVYILKISSQGVHDQARIVVTR